MEASKKYFTVLLAAALLTRAVGDIVVEGANGNDGVLNITTNAVIDLSRAETARDRRLPMTPPPQGGLNPRLPVPAERSVLTFDTQISWGSSVISLRGIDLLQKVYLIVVLAPGNNM